VIAKLISLMIGGVCGTLARYAVSGIVTRWAGTGFPYGTMAVNFLGCFIVGFLAVIAEEKFQIGPNVRLLLFVGFCGAFTTFSTFIFESSNLIRDGQTLRAFANVILSVTLGFIVFRIGVRLGALV